MHRAANNMDGNKMGTAYLTRSNSTASSTISLRLFRELMCAATTTTNNTTARRVGLRPISHDDYFVGGFGAGSAADEPDDDYVGSDNMLNLDESMSIGNNKSRHQSQNSQASSNNAALPVPIPLPAAPAPQPIAPPCVIEVNHLFEIMFILKIVDYTLGFCLKDAGDVVNVEADVLVVLTQANHDNKQNERQ